MDELSRSLETLFEGSHWTGMVIALRAIFFLFLVRILWLLLRLRQIPIGRGDNTETKGRFRIITFGLIALFLIVLVHQASWQLTGHMRPEFVEFMQQYDRRGFNPTREMAPGRLLDRNGAVLAFSEIESGRLMRRYPMGPATSHIIGYQNSRFGKTGIEKAAQIDLLGTKLDSVDEWHAFASDLIQNNRTINSKDMSLTLDASLQQTAYLALGSRRGAAVVLDATSGAILALASSPAFDPNQLSSELMTNPESPLLNRALSGLYPPGSTFKVALAALALESGFQGTIDCPADGFTTGPTHPPIRDHEFYEFQERQQRWPGHGPLNMTTALEKSSNTFFAQLGDRYAHTLFRGIASRFRFEETISIYRGPDSSIQIAASHLDSDENQDAYEFAQMGIGQGKLETTPMQMTLIAQSIANKGIMMKPFIVLGSRPTPLVRTTTETVALDVSRMMKRVVTHGTGRGIRIPGIEVAGKTGTAENGQGPSHSWFIGFAPADAPAIAFGVLVEHGGFGSATALPIARQLVIKANALGHLKPRP